MKWPNFLHVDASSHKLKVDQKYFRKAIQKLFHLKSSFRSLDT